PRKHITTGEGGASMTKDPVLPEKLRQIRPHGMVRDPPQSTDKDMAFDGEGNANLWYYDMPGFGYNYRLTDIQAALGESQLKKVPGFISRRAVLKEKYDRALAPYVDHVQPLKSTPGHPAWHLYAVLIDFEKLGVSR